MRNIYGCNSGPSYSGRIKKSRGSRRKKEKLELMSLVQEWKNREEPLSFLSLCQIKSFRKGCLLNLRLIKIIAKYVKIVPCNAEIVLKVVDFVFNFSRIL